MPKITRRALLGACAATSFALLAGSVQAQTFPAKPMRLVIPFAAGGGTDVLGRLLATNMATRLGQSIVVENITGAGGTIGAERVARSAADGYTMMLGTPSTILVNPAMQPNLSYNVERDFIPVSEFTDSPMVLIINKDLPWNSVRELIAAARSKPGGINFGSAGPGSLEHLSGELFNMLAQVKMTHVPYRGTAQSLVDLRAGNIQLIIENLAPVLQLIQNKDVKALGMGTLKRSSFLPDLPTLAEAGLTGFDSSTWSGLFVPAGTTPAVVAALQRAAVESARDANVIKSVRAMGADTIGSSAEEFRASLATRRKTINELVKVAGMTGG